MPSALVDRALGAWGVRPSSFWRLVGVGPRWRLRERFRRPPWPVTASSLTFTTILALVPFFTVALAVFTAFPHLLASAGCALQGWLVSSLVPDSISRQVLGYLRSSPASQQPGAAGFSILLFSALALILTIDRTLNDIWRVQRLRPWGSGC